MHACFENVKCRLIITLKEKTKTILIEGYWHKNHVNSSGTLTSGLNIVGTVHVWFHNFIISHRSPR